MRSKPTSRASETLPIDASMKAAGRKTALSIWMPLRPGRIASIASSMPRVTATVSAPGNFLDDEQQAIPAPDDGVADERLVILDHGCDVTQAERLVAVARTYNDARQILR